MWLLWYIAGKTKWSIFKLNFESTRYQLDKFVTIYLSLSSNFQNPCSVLLYESNLYELLHWLLMKVYKRRRNHLNIYWSVTIFLHSSSLACLPDEVVHSSLDVIWQPPKLLFLYDLDIFEQSRLIAITSSWKYLASSNEFSFNLWKNTLLPLKTFISKINCLNSFKQQPNMTRRPSRNN